MVWIGLISYPFYLWHWPLLALARSIEGETPSITLCSSLLAFSLQQA